MYCGILSVPQDLVLTLIQYALVNLSVRNTHTHIGVNHGSGVAGCRRPNDGQIINRIMFLGDRSAATQQLWPWCNVMAGHGKKTHQALHLSRTLTIIPHKTFSSFQILNQIISSVCITACRSLFNPESQQMLPLIFSESFPRTKRLNVILTREKVGMNVVRSDTLLSYKFPIMDELKCQFPDMNSGLTQII